MQIRLREQIADIIRADMGSDDDTADSLDDFGFNYPPHVVLRCFQALRHFGVLPEPGGLLDQEALLWDDIMTMFAVYNDTRREIDPSSEAPDDDLPVMNMTDMW